MSILSHLLSHLALAPRRAAHFLIRAYQLSLSAFVGRHCRHEPTCSAYMDEAIARHGLLAGGFLGAARLCRCHPWGTSGYDPVPEELAPLGARIRGFLLSRGLGAGWFGTSKTVSPDK